MSYEICAMDARLASTQETAYAAWNDGVYVDASLPASDRSARKWQVKHALLAFNGALQCKEPEPAPTGFLAKLFRNTGPEQRCLSVSHWLNDECTSYQVYDQAVEIDLPWNSPDEDVDEFVRELWRHLAKLSQLGYATLYDTERDVLLHLDHDFEVVKQGYLKSLNGGEEDAAEAGAGAVVAATAVSPKPTLKAKPTPGAPSPPDAPFTGNVDEQKPFWKR